MSEGLTTREAAKTDSAQAREQEVLNRWRKAYTAANGRPAPAVGIRGHGWYSLDGWSTKRRLKTFEEMAERLERRAEMMALEQKIVTEVDL